MFRLFEQTGCDAVSYVRYIFRLDFGLKKISGNLIILLNMRDIDALDGQDTLVQEGDEVTLLPHVQGG